MQPTVQRGAPLSRRTLWVLWILMILGALLFVYLSTTFAASTRTHLESWDWAVMAMTIYSAWSAYWFRKKWPKHLLKATKVVSPARRWSTIQLVSFSCAESIVVWGVFANMGLGAPSWLSYSLYAIGILLLVVFAPVRKPEAA